MTQDERLAKARDKFPNWTAGLFEGLNGEDSGSLARAHAQAEERIWFYYHLRIEKWVVWILFSLSLAVVIGDLALGTWKNGAYGLLKAYPWVMVFIGLATILLVFGIRLNKQKPPSGPLWEALSGNLACILRAVYGSGWFNLLEKQAPEVYDLDRLMPNLHATFIEMKVRFFDSAGTEEVSEEDAFGAVYGAAFAFRLPIKLESEYEKLAREQISSGETA